jgi:hypothetical protein
MSYFPSPLEERESKGDLFQVLIASKWGSDLVPKKGFAKVGMCFSL